MKKTHQSKKILFIALGWHNKLFLDISLLLTVDSSSTILELFQFREHEGLMAEMLVAHLNTAVLSC